MTKEKCEFCDYNLIKEEILWESDNFFLKVGIGIFAPGHIMMVSKQHISCFGDIPKYLIKDFLFIKEEIFSKIGTNFFPIIFPRLDH